LPMQPKFYADENVPLAVSNALKRRGIDVVTAQESDMLSRDGILFFTKQVGIGQAIEEIKQVHLAYNAEELYGVILFLPQQQ